MIEPNRAEDNSVQLPEDDFEAYESARTAKEDDAVEESEAAESDEDEAEPEAAPESGPEDDEQEQDEDEQPVKGKRLKKRFAQLTSKLRDLEAKLAERDKGVASPQGRQEEAQPADSREQDAPGKPEALDFDTDEEYQDALIEWKLEQRDLQRQAAQARAEHVKAYNARVAELKKLPEYADWDDVFESLKADDIRLPASFAEALNTDPHAAELSYYLAKNAKEAKRILALAPVAAIRELGKISARFDKAPEDKKPPVSKAPAPPRPVSSSKSAASEKSADAEDFTDYEKRRMRELRRR
jgi:hypothetical protein